MRTLTKGEKAARYDELMSTLSLAAATQLLRNYRAEGRISFDPPIDHVLKHREMRA